MKCSNPLNTFEKEYKMHSHIRTYYFPELVTFRFDPIFCDGEDDSILPKNGMIETMEINVDIQNHGNGEYLLGISLPEAVICCGDEGNPVLFWHEGGLSLEQLENDIEQIIERKELFI